MTAKMGADNVMEKGNNLAWHMIISFKPGEISDPNVAHEVAAKIADSVLKGKHEYVLSTHVDKDHDLRITDGCVYLSFYFKHLINSFFHCIYIGLNVPQGARTLDPLIKSQMLYRLS